MLEQKKLETRISFIEQTMHCRYTDKKEAVDMPTKGVAIEYNGVLYGYLHATKEDHKTLFEQAKKMIEFFIMEEEQEANKKCKNKAIIATLTNLIQYREMEYIEQRTKQLSIDFTLTRRLYLLKVTAHENEQTILDAQCHIEKVIQRVEPMLYLQEYFLHLFDEYYLYFALEHHSIEELRAIFMSIDKKHVLVQGHLCQHYMDYHLNYHMLESLIDVPQFQHKTDGVVSAKDYMLDIIINDISLSKKKFIYQFLTPKDISIKDLNGLYELAEVMIDASFNIQKASLLADVHRNSIVYRLERAKDKFNINLSEHEDAVNLLIHRSLKEYLKND